MSSLIRHGSGIPDICRKISRLCKCWIRYVRNLPPSPRTRPPPRRQPTRGCIRRPHYAEPGRPGPPRNRSPGRGLAGARRPGAGCSAEAGEGVWPGGGPRRAVRAHLRAAEAPPAQRVGGPGLRRLAESTAGSGGPRAGAPRRLRQPQSGRGRRARSPPPAADSAAASRAGGEPHAAAPEPPPFPAPLGGTQRTHLPSSAPPRAAAPTCAAAAVASEDGEATPASRLATAAAAEESASRPRRSASLIQRPPLVLGGGECAGSTPFAPGRGRRAALAGARAGRAGRRRGRARTKRARSRGPGAPRPAGSSRAARPRLLGPAKPNCRWAPVSAARATLPRTPAARLCGEGLAPVNTAAQG